MEFLKSYSSKNCYILSFSNEIRGTFGKFLAWSFISVTNLQTLSCWYHFKELSFRFVIAQISCGCYDASTKDIIVSTCTVCLQENAKFKRKI